MSVVDRQRVARQPLSARTTKIAVVGCGFVADLYLKTARLHPELEIVGVHDCDRERAGRFADHHGLRLYGSLDRLLSDAGAEIVLNLTNPRAHAAVSHACIDAGCHVYSEKPLAMSLAEARSVIEHAEAVGVEVAAAPCTLLSETAQTMWRALRGGVVGRPRLVYAELDDGMVHRMPYESWVSDSGTPWPWKDEFEVGCTLEHAGYALTWLCAFFGPARRVTAFSSELIPDKGGEGAVGRRTPDFSVACLAFEDGVVARLTCSIVAPHDHRFTIVGDEGLLATDETWFTRSPVYVRRRHRIRRRVFYTPWKRRLPLVGVRANPRVRYRGAQRIDFARGVVEMAQAVRAGRTPRLSGRFSLHVTELSLAIQAAMEHGTSFEPSTTFDPVLPMPWAATSEGGAAR